MLTRFAAGLGLLGFLIPLSLRAQQPAAAAAAPPAAPTVKVTGYLQARETYQNKIGLTGTINRARVSIEGTLPGHFSWRIQPEYEVPGTAGAKATVSLRDAFVRWSLSSWTVTAGQFKTPFTREFITSIAAIETADRATVVDSLAPKRDIGVMGEYAFGATGTLALGVFNGEGQNSVNNKDTTVLVVSRGTVRPIPQLSLGANIAYYRADSARYGFDAAFEQRGLTLKGEYIWEHRKAKRPEDNGWYALAAFRVLPWVQLVARQEDFRRNAISAAQQNEATTAGVNLEFGGRTRLLANYVSRKIGTPGVRHGGLITQIQVRF